MISKHQSGELDKVIRVLENLIGGGRAAAIRRFSFSRPAQEKSLQLPGFDARRQLPAQRTVGAPCECPAIEIKKPPAPS